MGQASSRTKHAQVVEEDPASLAETLPTGFFSTLQQRQGQEEQEQEQEQEQDQEQYEEYGGQDQGIGEHGEREPNDPWNSKEVEEKEEGEAGHEKEEDEEELSEPLAPMGMSLAYIEEFYIECGGRSALERLTLFDVFTRFILNFVNNSSQTSFYDYLRTQRHPSVGPASIFVSVSWSYDFVDVMDTLHSFLGNKDQLGSDSFVWFDFYSAYHIKLKTAQEVDYNEWESLLRRAADLFGTIHIIHIPWNHSFVQERNFFVETLESTVDIDNINKVVRFGTEVIKNYLNFMVDDAGADAATTDVEIVENVNTRFRLMHEMGRLHECGGECTNADMLYKQTLYNMRANEHVGSNHYNTVAVMNDFALLMCNVEVYGSKKLEDAEKLFGECIEILDNLIADGMKNIDIMRPLDSDVVIVKNNLACLYELQGKFQDAFTLHSSCAELLAEMLGPHHSLSILSRNNLATVSLKNAAVTSTAPTAEMENPEHMYEDCIQICYKLEGSTKKDKLWSTVYMTNLASVYFQVGHHLEMAEPLLRDGLEQLKILRGERHLDTLHAMYILAMFYYDNDRLDDGEHLLIHILHLADDSLGYQHRFTLRVMNTLSTVMGKLGKHEDALSVGIDCYEARLEVFGVDDDDTLASINSLSIIYNALNEHQEAERLLVACIEKITASLRMPTSSSSPSLSSSPSSASVSLSISSPTTENHFLRHTHLDDKQLLLIECLLNLGKSYQAADKLKIAEEHLCRCVEKAVDDLGKSHRLTLEAMHTLAGLLEKLERFEESENLYTQCLERRRTVLGEIHSDTLTTMNDLGYLYTSQKKYEEAEHMYLSCLSIASPVTGVVCMSNLGMLYGLLGRYDEAEPLLTDCLEKRKALLGDDHYMTVISQDQLNKLIELRRPPDRVNETENNNGEQQQEEGRNNDENSRPPLAIDHNHNSPNTAEENRDKNGNSDGESEVKKTALLEKTADIMSMKTPTSPAVNVSRSSFESPRAMKHLVENGYSSTGSNSNRSSFDSPRPSKF